MSQIINTQFKKSTSTKVSIATETFTSMIHWPIWHCKIPIPNYQSSNLLYQFATALTLTTLSMCLRLFADYTKMYRWALPIGRGSNQVPIRPQTKANFHQMIFERTEAINGFEVTRFRSQFKRKNSKWWSELIWSEQILSHYKGELIRSLLRSPFRTLLT